MRKAGYLPADLGLFLGFLAATNAQPDTSRDITVHEQILMQHDTFLCGSNCSRTFQITIRNSFMGDSLTLINTGWQGNPVIGIYVNSSGRHPWLLTVPMPPII